MLNEYSNLIKNIESSLTHRSVNFQDFKDFFIGNYYAIGHQYSSGKWTSGKIEDATFGACKNINEAIKRHLNREITIGSYPSYKFKGKWYCKFICMDFDLHDEPDPSLTFKKLNPLTLNIMNFLILLYKIPRNCILRDFSGRGIHVWIKLKHLTTLRRAFDYKVEIEKTIQETHDTKMEVFPLQNCHTIKNFGNFVKLPLSVNRNNDQYCPILDDFDLSRQGAGYSIPEWIPRQDITLAKARNKNEKSHSNHKRIEIDGKSQMGWFFANLKPCLTSVMLGETITHHHPSGNGHWFNIVLCNALHDLGASQELKIQAFQNQPDFNFETSKSQVESLEKGFKKQYARISCKTIQKKGFCMNGCKFKRER